MPKRKKGCKKGYRRSKATGRCKKIVRCDSKKRSGKSKKACTEFARVSRVLAEIWKSMPAGDKNNYAKKYSEFVKKNYKTAASGQL
jgi:hypothetical protein